MGGTSNSARNTSQPRMTVTAALMIRGLPGCSKPQIKLHQIEAHAVLPGIGIGVQRQRWT